MSFIFTMVHTIPTGKERKKDGETDKVGKTADAEKQRSLLKAKLSEIKLGHQMHR